VARGTIVVEVAIDCALAEVTGPSLVDNATTTFGGRNVTARKNANRDTRLNLIGITLVTIGY
jgi:hypothetical protein